MNSISQVQQDLLGRMEQLRSLSEATPVQPAQAFAVQPGEAGFAAAFDDAVRAVDAQQHRSGELMAAVDSGQSDDLVGAMIESQKASVSFSALMQVRNKLASAFDDIMKMPL
ncbi:MULTISPECIES: flagellar hook-basal body complex protein FliE [Pseudomonas]|jgi:flagellar hook-basal body complex protein FliE|uniref:Flagellar hook-basal body complex protein FliE n=2 Tax=Ectopseudomonas TaxID=3236654 RepID=A0A653B415_ECTOL|nr:MULTISPECIES: flagellar hook-basal body complex protein FliE [Pseudomonas]CAE6963665.1 Flagellar hook-basal body complex protein FliE [Pseudomonas oleovorans]QFT24546.1 flagellar hook-basal body protein FliE [Pseudomonas sp. THAF187a]QFT44733.1 flagellar hook-basal body protein FliE [Pseudomonas sp. THAF42]QTS86381.1 flagellar hook-basal body complex protein FliE [Pseudomonas khazarica]HIQ44158.1 flagellar hook-basal body protein FliE [Pseudomonas oleovorans]|tara:strand:- start:812 stop:1147 length:336 start_codon:yes stop_codon:yes gene_type:complete